MSNSDLTSPILAAIPENATSASATEGAYFPINKETFQHITANTLVKVA